MGILIVLLYLIVSLALKVIPVVLIFFIIAKITIKLFKNEITESGPLEDQFGNIDLG